MGFKSIMVIDDSEPDQFIAKNIIQKFDKDIEIFQAYDGQEALEILKDLPEQPGVIFLDINMPRMNGHEFLDEYSQWEKQANVVIMLTSSDQEKDREKSVAHKCVKKYFTKPLDLSDLQDTVQIFKS